VKPLFHPDREGGEVTTHEPAGRREELAERATDYVLEHGIAGLSLRPLAAAIGTSDRMLVYHFTSKDALLAELIERSNDRSLRVLADLPAAESPEQAVRALWQAWHERQVNRCLRVYAQSAALGLLGDEPYLGAARRSNAAWTRAVAGYLVRSGVPAERAGRVGELIDAALFGLWLDEYAANEAIKTARIVDDLAETARRLSGNGAGSN
jgi:AcrR family transcriptional regulator